MCGRRHTRACTVLLATIVSVAGLRSTTAPVEATAASLVLSMRMTSTQPLSPLTAAALKSETESIWRRHRLRVEWVPAAVDAPAAGVLPVVVLSRAVQATGTTPWTVGELVRVEGGPGLVLASITGAHRIVSESGQARLLEPQSVSERRLGVVLGRAIAHEIGHYLLQTNSHAHEGLMRARIDAREFTDPRPGAFTLDRAAAAHVATLAETGRLPADSSATGAFSYSAR